MTVTRQVRYTFRCDDGRYCRDDNGRPARTTIWSLYENSKDHACKMARLAGWKVKYGVTVQCPICVTSSRKAAAEHPTTEAEWDEWGKKASMKGRGQR